MGFRFRMRAAVAAAFMAFAILGGADEASAQGSSSQALIDEGQTRFEELRYEESIQALTAALVRPGTTPEQKQEIYRLLAYNYITLSQFEEADAAVRALLVIDENFSLPETESPRFRDFFQEAREKWIDEGKPGLKEPDKPEKPLAPVKLSHTPPGQVEPGTAVKIEGSVDDADTRIASIELAYRTGNEGKFTTKSIVFSMGDFRGLVPANVVKPPFVEYYLLALDADGLPLASRGDSDAPLRISVRDDSGGSVFESPWFWIPVGVAVVGGVIATAVIASSGDSGTGGSRSSTVIISVGE